MTNSCQDIGSGDKCFCLGEYAEMGMDLRTTDKTQ